MSFIVVFEGKYKNKRVLENIVSYGLGVDFDDLNKYSYTTDWFGYGVNTLTPYHAINSFRLTQRYYCKEDNRQVHHFALSIYRNKNQKKTNKEKWAFLMLHEIGNIIYEMGYQNIAVIHNEGYNVHIHFVVNAINYNTGLMMTNTKSFYNYLLFYLKHHYRYNNWEGIIYK